MNCPCLLSIYSMGGLYNNLDIQEFMIVPAGFDTFQQALQAGCEVFHHLKKIFNAKGYTQLRR